MNLKDKFIQLVKGVRLAASMADARVDSIPFMVEVSFTLMDPVRDFLEAELND